MEVEIGSNSFASADAREEKDSWISLKHDEPTRGPNDPKLTAQLLEQESVTRRVAGPRGDPLE